MLAILPYDLLHKILKFQEPEEIIALYDSTKDAIQEMIKHTNFIVECKVFISNKAIEWFESKNIKVKLLEEYKIDADGAQCWYQNGKYHRDNDLPAVIFSNGNQFWYKNGKFHRDNDLPAIIFLNGRQDWYQHGKLHRDNDLPAVIAYGDHYWYKNGLFHRDNDLPAVIYEDGGQKWYKNGVKYTPI
jgi:hypothetical protein